MRDFVSDFNSMESKFSESDSVERNSDSNSNSNYGNYNSIPIQILAIPIQFQFRSDWEKPIQFQFQFQFRNWNWQTIPIPDRNWPQLCTAYFSSVNYDFCHLGGTFERIALLWMWHLCIRAFPPNGQPGHHF